MQLKIYLASPYTHEDPDVMQARFEAVSIVAARMMEQGFVVLSPIAHSHPIAQYMKPEMVVDSDFWLRQDLAWLAECQIMYVLMLPGWETSVGIKREIEFARQQHTMVYYIDPSTMQIDMEEPTHE